MDNKTTTKEHYEAPATKRVRVVVESGICASSITINEDEDIASENHVSIEKQGADSFDFTTTNSDDTNWTKWD